MQNFVGVPITGVQNGADDGHEVESAQLFPTPTEFPEATMHAGARSDIAVVGDEHAASSSVNAIARKIIGGVR